ncbi:hypothetical protein TRFO_34571 [Tritrichomonas foetus]|uniref:Endoplasmic reticulum-Golgi intermediate compartment protein 3 n=1 Tax=Tritrichomonas foetus TaxID=1144522 RepID=A0A1J4JP85_9EUKA|nr:hypothetical protein TRFO_34571 [Tritrichomonas foetus]|eukprot:OHS99084.1 hypothetical protein TRFO_34571 [Tritrichomonas foetus]
MRKFDLFPKVSDENFDVRTKTGGIISICTFIFMLIIVAVESSSNQKTQIKQRAVLEDYKSEKPAPLPVYFNITVAYPCHLLHLTVQDVTGNHQMNFGKKITRQRLDRHLKPISPPVSDDDPKSIFSSCGGCLGSNYSKCCLTCFDVASSFILQNQMVPNLDNVEQCVRDRKAVEDMETCRIWGRITTSFSNGEIQISAGGEIPMPVHYKHDLTYFGENVNLTHWISTVRFGEDFEGLRNPLDDSRWMQRARGFFFYRYTVNLVKTYTEKNFGYQYSAYFNQYHIEKTVSRRHPAIAIKFDTAPIAVQLTVEKKSFLTFLTSLFAIIGGGFTIGGLIDSFLFSIHSHKD